jgi:long-subunit fatty acid transport protein
MRPFFLPHVSYIRHFGYDDRWAAGLGVFAPAGFKAEYSMNNPVFGTHDYRSLGGLVKILPGLAWQATDRLSVGATLGVGISRVEIDGPVVLQTGGLTGVPTLFDLHATGATPVWSLGMQYKLAECTTIGAAYVSESRFRLDGHLDAHVPGFGPALTPGHFDAQLDIVWPRSFGVGVVHRLADQHRIAADVIWYDWSGAFDQLDLTLTDSNNPLFTAVAGPVIKDTYPLDWQDSTSLRLGYEYFATCADVWRAGYVYHPRPVPNATLNPYLDGVLEHAFSAGYGRYWEQWMLNAGYQYSFGPAQSVGTSQIVGGDFDFSTFQAQAHWLMVSVGRKF